MAQRKTLTEEQILVLRWVSKGCPEGVMTDLHHRISTAALQKRGLVEVTGKRDTWSAEITSAGRDYLEAVDGPSPPIPRQANSSVTEQLIDDVIDAGGTLVIPEHNYYDENSIDYERRARLAEDHGKVPEGKWLICIHTGEGKELRLIDAIVPTGPEATDLLPVEIPEKVNRYRPAVRRFRDAKSRHEVSRDQMPRMLKIGQAITVEAERRGWTVKVPPEPTGEVRERDWSARNDGHLALFVGEREYALRLHEEKVKLRGPWDDEVKRYRDSYYRYGDPPKGNYDTNGTGVLEIELIDKNPWRNGGRQSRWADRKSWSLESRLPYLFREMERRLIDAARQAEENRINTEEKAERDRLEAETIRIQWEQHMQVARGLLLDQQRKEILLEQVSDWQRAESLRAYRNELESTHGKHPGTESWIIWIDEHIKSLDPLSQPPVLPEAPEETVDALQPFMPEGWSAQSPELVFDPRHGHRQPRRHW